MFTDLRLKINNFIRRNKWKIILFFIGWFILIAISTVLGNIKITTPITTYKPYEPIIDNGQTTPSKWHTQIENTIKTYIELCNNKEYEKAYKMISEGARKTVYPKLEDFKAYVDYVFSEKRIFAIQNYSNRDNVYIYRVRIFENIMETGLTFSETFKYFEEKFVFTENDGKLIMGVKGYIGDQKTDFLYEDKYIQIAITNRNSTYDEETYSIDIINKTDYELVILDDIAKDEIQLETENNILNLDIEGLFNPICLEPHQKGNYYLKFIKFYDEGVKSTGLIFNNIRVLRSYSGNEELKEQELKNAVELYSITIPLK